MPALADSERDYRRAKPAVASARPVVGYSAAPGDAARPADARQVCLERARIDEQVARMLGGNPNRFTYTIVDETSLGDAADSSATAVEVVEHSEDAATGASPFNIFIRCSVSKGQLITYAVGKNQGVLGEGWHDEPRSAAAALDLARSASASTVNGGHQIIIVYSQAVLGFRGDQRALSCKDGEKDYDYNSSYASSRQTIISLSVEAHQCWSWAEPYCSSVSDSTVPADDASGNFVRACQWARKGVSNMEAKHFWPNPDAVFRW